MNDDAIPDRGISRRDFLSRGAAGLYLSGGAFGFLNSMVTQQAKAGELDPATAGNRLVVLQLGGGNDTLNTIIPYAHDESDIYYASRPALSIPSHRVIDLDGTFGLHPSMGAIKNLWDSAELAILHGVGYPNPNLSHFAATDKWHSAKTVGTPDQGWLERLFDYLAENGESSPLIGVEFATRMGLAFGSGRVRATVSQDGDFRLLPSMSGASSAGRLRTAIAERSGRFDRSHDSPALDFVRRSFEQSLGASDLIAGVASTPDAAYPDTALGKDFKTTSDMIQAGLPTKVFYVHAPGFDTHAGQVVQRQPTVGTHANLLGDVANSLGAFADDMKEAGMWENTLVFVFSEFSRKVIQNGGLGSDHGAGQALLFAGGSLVPGMHGTFPSMQLSARVQNHSLDFSTDFRRVYRTVLERWLGVSSAASEALFPEAPADFSLLPFLPELP